MSERIIRGGEWEALRITDPRRIIQVIDCAQEVYDRGVGDRPGMDLRLERLGLYQITDWLFLVYEDAENTRAWNLSHRREIGDNPDYEGLIVFESEVEDGNSLYIYWSIRKKGTRVFLSHHSDETIRGVGIELPSTNEGDLLSVLQEFTISPEQTLVLSVDFEVPYNFSAFSRQTVKGFVMPGV